ncbi:MAG: thioredoxin family protein [Candidatus Aminicenantes bacterium]|nr:thioredoxin family protein [Candidatus Aminicenantes bacterium]
MDLLNTEVREATKKKFDADLEGKVTLIHFTQESSRLVLPERLKDQECLFCRETKQLIEEVAALSDKIELRLLDFTADKEQAAEYGIDKIPALAVLNEKDPGIRFYGIPSGYEYSSFIECLVDVSKGTTTLSEKTKAALKTVDRDIHLQVFITPTCPYCSMSVRLAHQFALESPFIRADMVESSEFPHLANRYNVMAVPRTVINDTAFLEGAMPEDRFLKEIMSAAASIDKNGSPDAL